MNAAAIQKHFQPLPELFPDFEHTNKPPAGELQALGNLSQIAPGVWTSGIPAFELPSHLLCKILPHATVPGAYTLEPEGSWPGYVRMSDDIGTRLGIIGLSATSLRRLLALGYIDHCRPHINGIFISIESLLAHLKRTSNDCAEETSFWTPARIREWREMIESTNNQRPEARDQTRDA